MQSVHPLDVGSLQEVPLCPCAPHIPPKRGLLEAIKLSLRLRSQFPKVLPSEAFQSPASTRTAHHMLTKYPGKASIVPP